MRRNSVLGQDKKSHEVSGELDKSAEVSAMVAGWKKDSSGLRRFGS